MFEFYKTAIMEAVEVCQDADLLDLVWKMLLDSAKAPSPIRPNVSGVKTDANNSRDKGLHRAVSIQICGSAPHTTPHSAGVGNRRAELPGVCGGADSLPRAA